MPHLDSTEAHAFTCLIFIHSSMFDLSKARSGQNHHLAKFQKISLPQDRSLKFFFQVRLLPCFQKNTLWTLWLWTMRPSVYPGMGERVGGEPHRPAWRWEGACPMAGGAALHLSVEQERYLAFSSLGPDELGAWTLSGADLCHSTWGRRAPETRHWLWAKEICERAQSTYIFTGSHHMFPAFCCP